MRYLSLLFLLILATGASADPDSLAVEERMAGMSNEDRLAFLQDETARVQRNDPAASIRYATMARDLATTLGDEANRSRALLNLGVGYYYQGDYREALRYYEEALASSESIGDQQGISRALNNIGVLYFVWGEHDRALEHYLRAMTVQEEIGDTGGVARCRNNIAAVHQAAGRFESAEENYRIALELYREIGNRTLEAGTLNNLALVAHELGEEDDASRFLLRALELEREDGDLPGEALSLNNLGMVRSAQGRQAEARELLEEALAIRRDIGDRQGESVSLQLLGSVYVAEGRVAEGLPLLEEALAIAEELGVKELVRDDQLALVEAWEAAGDYERALEYHRLYKQTHDELFNDQRASQMAAAEARFELDLKDNEIATLRREAEFDDVRRRFLWIVAGLLAVTALLLWNRYRFRNRMYGEIMVKNEALRDAHHELEKAARQELAHVARVATLGELTGALAHELRQPLTGITANARAAQIISSSANASPERLDEALEGVKVDADRAREIINRLQEMMRKGEERRDPHDLNLVVRDALAFVAGSARQHGVELVVELAPAPVIAQCDRIQLQQVVLNLVQNAITALEDSGFKRVTVSVLSEEPEFAEIRVVDTGPELDAEVLANMLDPFYTTKPEGLGMGLPICQTIVEAHEGSLVVERADGGGLIVRCQVPVVQG